MNCFIFLKYFKEPVLETKLKGFGNAGALATMLFDDEKKLKDMKKNVKSNQTDKALKFICDLAKRNRTRKL